MELYCVASQFFGAETIYIPYTCLFPDGCGFMDFGEIKEFVCTYTGKARTELFPIM